MKTYYRRDQDQNYIVVTDCPADEGSYVLKMLAGNAIPSFLRLELRCLNGEEQLWYRISGYQTVDLVFGRKGFSGGDIRSLFAGILCAFQNAGEYLLDTADIWLDPEKMYVRPREGKILFLYVPGIGKQQKECFDPERLGEYLLKHLDHADREAVDLGYRFYEEAAAGNFSFRSWLEGLGPGDGAGMGRGREAREEGDGLLNDDSYSDGFFFRKDHGSGAAEEADPFRNNHVGRKRQDTAFGQAAEECQVPDGHPQKEERQKKRAVGIRPGKKEKDRKRIWILAGIAAGAALIFGLLTVLLHLDLQQAGALAFAMVAVFWLLYGVVFGRREREHSVWEEEIDQDAEDEFMEALMRDVYDQDFQDPHGDDAVRYNALGNRGPATVGKGSTAAAENRNRAVAENAGTEVLRNTGMAATETGGMEKGFEKTRYLGETGEQNRLVLVSEEPRRCRDLPIETGNVIIGKDPGSVDILIGHDGISRLHARLEQTTEGVFLTDLNSTNGTYVNRQRLSNQTKQVHDGDRISFAGLHFRLRM